LLVGLFVWQITARSSHIHDLRSISASDVVNINLGSQVITDPGTIDRIVKALNGVQPHEPNHGAFGDKLDLTLKTKEGRSLSLQVAWSFDEPGAVLEFYSGDPYGTFAAHGEGLCAQLPGALETAGFQLLRFQSDRLIRDLSPEDIADISVAGRRITDPQIMGSLLDAMRDSRHNCSPGHGVPVINIVFALKDGKSIRFQAAQGATEGQARFWVVTGTGPENELTFAYALSRTLGTVLKSISHDSASTNPLSGPGPR
jgi:hypothetical protein